LEVARVAVANRSIERAVRVVDELIPGGAATLPLKPLSLIAVIRDYSVIVNATSIGWNSHEAVLSDAVMDQVAPRSLIVDLTYRSTALLRSAERRGLPTLDGLPMLVHQGARSFELWTGKPAPVEVMMRAAEAARSAG
jgi:shikimate dehydrogenase